MSYWALAFHEPRDDGDPTLNATRRLSDDQFERLSAANNVFRRTLGQTTWNVLQYNYSCFALLEQQLRDGIAAHSTTMSIHAETIQVPIVASVVNFLNSMHMFLGQSQAELGRLDRADSGSRESAWNEVRWSEHDDHFAYRFLYRFRNYVHHVGLPLSIWNISVALTQSDELVRRAASGESVQDNLNDSREVIVQILLGESPSDLIKNYTKWSTVEAELESLTIEIDLSEQIHMVMECLTRIAEAFQEQFKVELSQGVNDFKTIVGNFEDYPSRPFLAKISEDRPAFSIEMMDLEFERFLQAEGLLAGTTPPES